jgi:hypothetical protein
MLQMTVVPAAVVFRNQSVQGTLVSNMADVDETLNFAKRGRAIPPTRCLLSSTNTARQTALATHSCGNLQIQRSMSGIEERQGSWQDGGRLQHGIDGIVGPEASIGNA